MTTSVKIAKPTPSIIIQGNYPHENVNRTLESEKKSKNSNFLFLPKYCSIIRSINNKQYLKVTIFEKRKKKGKTAVKRSEFSEADEAKNLVTPVFSLRKEKVT